MFFGFFDPTFIILIPAIIITLVAQMMVNNAYNKYSRIRTNNNLTGYDAANEIMRANGLNNIRIQQIPGNLTDNYNPKNQVMSLSQGVMNQPSIASVGIAAHEAGHAIQHNVGYWPIKVRNFIVPICGFCSNAAWPLFFIGLIFARTSRIGIYLMDIGIVLFGVSLIFYLITLPVEFDASRRAVKALREQNLLEENEIQGVKKVLTAAALTYVASMAMALSNLLRLLVLRNRRG